jgi:hypothetical protein
MKQSRELQFLNHARFGAIPSTTMAERSANKKKKSVLGYDDRGQMEHVVFAKEY